MMNFQTARAMALTLALAFAAAATPALAKSGSAHRGAQARAQAIESVGEEGVSAARVRALHECNGRVAGFKGYNQMATPRSLYRACMEEHGEPE